MRNDGLSRIPVTLLVALASSLTAGSVHAQWLQWGGPDRNFQAKSGQLAKKWPKEGPRRLWKRELGDGYGTILVDGQKLYAMYRVDQNEFSVSLDANTGGALWEHKNPSPTTPLMEEYGPGPSSTPLVVGDRLYTIGTNMLLACFDKTTGKIHWKHDLVTEYDAEVPGRGYSSSPIAYRSMIILPVGGKKGSEQSMMAFDLQSGDLAWKKHGFRTTHSSPVLIRFQGEDQLVQFMGGELAGFNPATGELLWSHPHQTQYGANLSTPVWDGKSILFCSAAYDSGARAIRLKKEGDKTVTEELWYSRKMRLHHGNAIHHRGTIYGSSGDFGPAFFMAMDLESGKVLWRKRGFRKATCISNGGDAFILLDEDGKLAIARATPDEFEVYSDCVVAERYAWAAPTLAGTTLYVRDRKHIMAFDLSAPAPPGVGM